MRCAATNLGDLLKEAIGAEHVAREVDVVPPPPLEPRDAAPAQPWPDAAIRFFELVDQRITSLEARVLELEARISTHH